MPHKLAGLAVPQTMLVNVSHLRAQFFGVKPDVSNSSQLVSFGTSGHRGSALHGTFNESHVAAITQAICDYRKAQNISGPLYMGMDTHALSEPAHQVALEVLHANEVNTIIQTPHGGNLHTPTPVISHAILAYNKGRSDGLADGIVITPSHNPPEDGGFKYNPPHGGPSGTDVTDWIQDRANALLRGDNQDVKRSSIDRGSSYIYQIDFADAYIRDLANVVDMDAIHRSGLKIGVDPLGGAAWSYWERIAHSYGLNLTVVNRGFDPTFGFMRVDHDGKIRMDCSSPYAMAGLVEMKDRFDIAFGNDADTDRHGIVVPSVGLMNPNHYLSVAIQYLYTSRDQWDAAKKVGKTLVSSSMIDRVAASLNRRVYEVPVGFKWFVDGLLNGELGFGGEESAGASFLRRDGTVWTTDKDGIVPGLLAAEIMAVRGIDPGFIYQELTERFGNPVYSRTDVPATSAQKKAVGALSPSAITATMLAGENILATLTAAPGNGVPIGGLKVVTENGWFALRPSGTEDGIRLYAESFRGPEHLSRIQTEARTIFESAIGR